MNTENNLLSDWKWDPPDEWLKIKTIDMHTGGEPLRVYTHGLPEIKGDTILEKRAYFRDNYDYIRTGTMFEPRGHADMYGAVITEPSSKNSDFGTFFLHNEGYSTMCGHAIIALVKLVLETGIISKPGDNPELIIDAPPGQIKARANLENGKVTNVSFLNVPSFVLMKDENIVIDGIGKVNFDIAFGGAFYVLCNISQFNFSMSQKDYHNLIDCGRKIKLAVMEKYSILHPFEDELSFLYGTIFYGPARYDKNRHSQNVCVFADGEVDRSSTGSGVSARSALLYSNGMLNLNQVITIESILGTTMNVEVKNIAKYGPFDSVISEVSGTAYITGNSTFYFDPDDPLRKGFILR